MAWAQLGGIKCSLEETNSDLWLFADWMILDVSLFTLAMRAMLK